MATSGAVGDGSPVAPPSLHKDSSGSVHVADPEILFLGDFSRQGHDLLIEHDGATLLVEDYFLGPGANLVAPNGAFLGPSLVRALAGPLAPGQYAQAGDAPAATGLTVIGKVVSIEGTASATHSDGVTVNLANGDPVYQGDVVQTGQASKLGISFIDDSVFSMSADARMVLDELVFDPAKAADSSMVVNLVQGSFVFVTGQVAPAGDMKVETPVATMGIRGTTPKVLVDTNLGISEFGILPDPDSGKIGSYLLIDKTTGEILGTVESVGDKWVITSLSGEAVKVAKSGVDLLEDEAAMADIRDAVSKALGERTEYNGSSSFQQVAFNSSASTGGQDGAQNGGDGAGPGGGNGGIVDTNPDKDDPPIAGDDAFSTNEDLGIVANVINSSGGGPDGDPDGFAVTVTQVNGVALNFVSGTASVVLPANADLQTVGANLLISQNGGITYDPTSAFNYLAVGEYRTDSFTYTITDKFGFTDTATVSITVEGRNDAPVITDDPVSTTLAESSEAGGVGGAFSGGPTTGTLAFTDVDISDTGHTYQVVSVVETPNGGAPSNPLGGTALLNMLSLAGSSDSGATGTDGSIVWTFTGTEDQFDYLALGETVTLAYTVQVTDPHGATDTQTVTVTIIGAAEDGSNDEPVILAPTDVTETLAETEGALSTTGSFTVGDVDITDVVSITGVTLATSGNDDDQALPDPEILLAMFSPQSGVVIDGASTSGTVNWEFDAGTDAFDYLAVGESLTLTYTVTLADDNGAQVTQDVTITITGTNDAPVITLETGDDVSETLAEAETALTTSGSFSVLDVDTTDVVTVKSIAVATSDNDGGAPNDSALLDMLTLDPLVDGTIIGGTQTTGSVGWSFNSGLDQFDYLAVGEQLTITYTVTVTDDNGAEDTQTITLVIEGTNDAPVIAETTGDGFDTGAIAELADGDTDENDYSHSTTGSIGFSDVDASDTHTVSFEADAGNPTDVPSATFALTNPGSVNADGSIDWEFTVDDADLDFLAEGETREFTYSVTVDDGNGGTDTRDVVVTVTGSNDQPLLTAATGEDEGSVTEAVDTQGDGGTLDFTDVDLTDAPQPGAALSSLTALAADGVTPFDLTTDQEQAIVSAFTVALGNGSANNGTVDWTFDLDGYDLSFLGEGEVVTAIFTVSVDDGNGGVATRDVEIAINGANGGDRDDTLFGTSGEDVLLGGLGNDTIYGLGANDYLEGGEGDDTLDGGEGDDWLAGGEGTDTYVGGGTGPDQFDAISFRDETGTTGVYANLTTGVVTDTYGNTESATGIEEVDGSANDDTLIGNEADNYFQGHDGSDSYDGAGSGFDQVSFADETGGTGAVVNLALGSGFDTYGSLESFTSIEVLRGSQWNDQFTGDANNNAFRGLAGDDEFDGGGGWDTVRYDRDANYGGTAGVTVSLLAGTATDGFGDTDTLFGIERVIGTDSGDWLIGDNEVNELIGLDGGDTLEGFSGNDHLEGGGGDDTLDGGQGDDWLVGGEGVDTYIGGGSGPDQFDAISFRDETGTAGVYANLTTGVVTDTYGNIESATGIEEVEGSANDDILIGNEADNFFRGGDGADSFDGGSGGFDQVSFADETGGDGVAVNLALGVGTDTWGNAETFTGIETLRGSQWNDGLIGDSNDNTFRGLAGDDTMDGAGGNDTVRYDRDANYGGTNGVTVDLAAGTAIDGFGDSDILIDIEHARGTQFADSLSGDGDYNQLIGFEGDDALFGDGGDDQLFGGDGSDDLTGGFGSDEFIFYAGESGIDDILDFEIGGDLISLFGYDESATVISLADNGLGGSYLMVDGQAVASLADVSFETDLIVDYTDHHVITMMATV